MTRPNPLFDDLDPERARLSDDALRRRIISRLYPRFRLDGRSPDVVEAVYELIVSFGVQA